MLHAVDEVGHWRRRDAASLGGATSTVQPAMLAAKAAATVPLKAGGGGSGPGGGLGGGGGESALQQPSQAHPNLVKLLQVISTPRCAAFCQNRHERPLQSLPHAGSAGGRAGGGETAGGSAGGEMMRAGQQPSHAQPREFCRMEHVMPRSRKLWHCLPLHWARQDRTAGEEGGVAN